MNGSLYKWGYYYFWRYDILFPSHILHSQSENCLSGYIPQEFDNLLPSCRLLLWAVMFPPKVSYPLQSSLLYINMQR